MSGDLLDIVDLDIVDLDIAELDIAELDIADHDIAELDIAVLDIADRGNVDFGTAEAAEASALTLSIFLEKEAAVCATSVVLIAFETLAVPNAYRLVVDGKTIAVLLC